MNSNLNTDSDDVRSPSQKKGLVSTKKKKEKAPKANEMNA